MATLVLVLMVPVCVGMFVDVSAGLMLMLMPVMAVGTTFVAMLVLMLVFVVATHRGLSSFSFISLTYIFLSILPSAVNGSSAPTGNESLSCPNFWPATLTPRLFKVARGNFLYCLAINKCGTAGVPPQVRPYKN
jgi:hypothetical protein